MSEQMTTAERRATCEACTLADVMKDCPFCLFNVGKLEATEPTYQRATGADIFRIWRELWGYAVPLVIEPCKHGRGTVYDWKTYPATLEEPSETVGSVSCDECGDYFELGYEPEGMRLYHENGKEW
jgi:hypothetical protein